MKDRNNIKKITIIGAGISGLTSAFYLLKKARKGQISKITIYEAKDKIGGAIDTDVSSDIVSENGPLSLFYNRAAIRNLIQDLNLENELIFSSKNLNKFIFNGSKLIKFSPFLLFRPLVFLSVVREIFVFKSKNNDETVFEFFKRHFGRNFTEFFIIPLTYGIWGGGAQSLLIRKAFPKLYKIEKKYRSIVIGFLIEKFLKRNFKIERPVSVSFEKGLSYFIEKLFESIKKLASSREVKLNVILNYSVKSLELKRPQSILINNNEYTNYCVVSTDPTIIKLFGFRKISDEFALNYNSLIVCNLIYEKNSINFEKQLKYGYGFLCPRNVPFVLGVQFVNNIFKSQMKKKVYIRILLGGDKSLKLIQATNEDILKICTSFLNSFDNNIFKLYSGYKITRWKKFIPVLDKKHESLQNQFKDSSRYNQGLYLTGHFQSPNINSSILTSEETAESILTSISHETKS